MPSYTLYYFNGRGRAEILRMIFNVAGAQFTDKRFEFNEWDKIRNDMPSSSVPVLEIDGKDKMPETMAIARYLAREYGFHGKNNMDMFRVDYICDCLYEIMHDYMRYFHEKSGRFRVNMKTHTHSMGIMRWDYIADCFYEIMHHYMRYYHWKNGRFRSGSSDKSDMAGEMQRSFMETCRRVLPFLEKTLEMRNGGSQFFMGDQMMVCDMMLYCFLENPMMENQTMFNSYPKLMALWKRVAGHPKVSGYLKKRSNTNW